jgi:hypothetical protein
MAGQRLRQRRIVVWLMVVSTLVSPLAEAGGPFKNPLRKKTSVEDLAQRIDKLERELQYTGRINVKAPDVWGQARLTAHREEFEQQMAGQLTAFTPTTNAEIAIADQAFLSQALTLSGAARGINGQPLASSTAPNAPQYVTFDTTTLNSLNPAQTVVPTPPAGTGTDDRIAKGSFTSSYNIVANGPNALLTATRNTDWSKSGAFQLEPEIILDQRKRFLDHLHEIRRINEGDDTSDSPGYSLNLVRVPVSILPGDHTRENYGAEVTFIAEPHVTEELLPTTFRELVVNDLIDQLALPIVKLVDLHWDKFQIADELLAKLSVLQQDLRELEEYKDVMEGKRESNGTPSPPAKGNPAESPSPAAIQQMRFREPLEAAPVPNADAEVQDATRRINEAYQALKSRKPFVPPPRSTPTTITDEQKSYVYSKFNEAELLEKQSLEAAKSILALFRESISSFQVAVPRERRSRYPIAPSQIKNTFGDHELAILALGAYRARDHWKCRDRVALADIHGFLHEELESAFDYLSSVRLICEDPQHQLIEFEGVWNSWLVPTAVEIRQSTTCQNKRESFFSALPLPPDAVTLGPSSTQRAGKGAKPTEVLAWAILVESALLNQQLNDDLKQVSQDPECGCVFAGDLQFYGPDPTPEARQAFVQYVKCRWPVRVFALDPVTQQQNVADTFSLRREGQLAIALAFSKGLVNAQSLTRYMRRIEQDIRTISLNNTHVGFGAGNDTFGWRFFPRVQTPDVESNLVTIGRDLIVGGPNRDQKLKRWRIEPGMRECVALVVMPSFIKHMRFDVRTNWFKLVPDKLHAELFHKGEVGVTMKSTVEWSREVQAIENSIMACVKDEHLYRPGEVERMVKRGQQISRQLPLNTLYAQVPYENTLGGFEMFASGVTDLAPELVGFYGAPGVDPERETTLFLVGDNFSVHGTRVVAGNQSVQTSLLSREVAQVTLPRQVRIDRRQCQPRETHAVCNDKDCSDYYVEVRLATPYGVSSPLYIPVAERNGFPAPEKPVTPSAPDPVVEWVGIANDYVLIYQPKKATPPNTAITLELSGISTTSPQQYLLVSPKERPLPDGEAQVTIRVKSSSELPIQPGTIVYNARLTAKNKQLLIEGQGFKDLQTTVKDLVLATINNKSVAAWPLLIELSLDAEVAVANAKSPATTPIPLKLSLNVLEPR